MKALLTTVCLLLSVVASGQSALQRLEHLKELAKKETNDSEKVKMLDAISFGYCTIDPNEGLQYAAQALELAQRIQWPQGEAAALNDYGNNYLHQAEYPKALDFFLQSLRIYERLKDEKAIGMVQGNIGTLYFNQNDYDKALQYFFAALDKAQQSGDGKGELLATGNIGSVYYAEGRYDDALKHMMRARNLSMNLEDRKGTIRQSSNIGTVYSAMKNLPLALTWYFDALHLSKAAGELQTVAANQGNIGETYLDMARDQTLTKGRRQQLLDSAINFLTVGIATAKRVNYKEAVLDFLQASSEAHEMEGDYKLALAKYKDYIVLKDSIFNLENNQEIARLETRRELEVKDKDLQIANLALSRKKEERWSFIGGLVLLATLAVILYRSVRHKQRSNELLSAEKRRSDTLLRNIMPEDIIDELKTTGMAQAKQFDEASVLFTDFVNFTGIAEKLSPQELVRELHECFSAFDAIVQRNGLEKIKTIGDAYLAVCGLPRIDPKHAEKCAKAAFEILEFLENRKRQQRAFQVKIGIHSGPVVAGIVGVQKFAYDIWGDTVNTAARMEQNGMPDRINISQRTYELLRDSFDCEFRGHIKAKNKGEIAMYFLNGLKGSTSSVPQTSENRA